MATYTVVLKGVEPGKDPEVALQGFAALSRKNAEVLRPLLGLRSFAVKKGVDQETAVQYQAAIRQTGFLSVIEPEIVAQAGAITAPPPAPSTADERSAPAIARARGIAGRLR